MVRKEANDAPKIRELFVEELTEVQGGQTGIKELLEKIGCCDSTMACGEEGPSC